MQVVVEVEPGVVELNWMWLPTWIGMNTTLKNELERALKDAIVGKTVDDANELVMNYICNKFPKISGLYDYLDGLKYIRLR